MTEPFAAGQSVTVFRSRLRAGSTEEYGRVAGEMEAAVRAAPGFVDMKTFTADDGERVTLATFDSPEALAAWRDDPAHRRAQVRGRAEFYADYSVQTGICTHAVRWTPATVV